ncbi:MAG: lipopolysaccharide core heptose(I) kinase RfaP [Gammaproteobacteria bacterium]|nr:lipopolysaccharide core heptose(I) kinase RfaP [Gammaproteobacteria bacterium]
MMWLDPSVREYFYGLPRLSAAQPRNDEIFDAIMQCSGEVFRALENRKTQRIVLANQPYFLKQHQGIGWKEIFKNLIQGRWPILSAKNELRAIERLHALNIPTLTVVGYGWRGWNPARRQSFLLTRELPQHVTLEALIQQPLPFTQKRKLIQAVAHIARTLHQNGINHRDFYLCHLVLDYNDTRLYVIDLHRAGVRRTTPQRWIIKDLAGLYFSSLEGHLTQRDYMRFMKYYSAASSVAWSNKEKHFWLKVKNRGEKLYRKHTSSRT